MKKNRIVKMVISAAAAAYVAVMPVQAEETGEEIIIRECEDPHAGPYPDEHGQMADGNEENHSAVTEGMEYSDTVNKNTIEENDVDENAAEAVYFQAVNNREGMQPGPGRACLRNVSMDYREEQASYHPEDVPTVSVDCRNQEAEYSAMGQVSGGDLEENAAKDPKLEELIRKTGYGPHLMALKKEEEEKEEAEPEPQPEPVQPAYSEEDLYILAHAICGEGQGYPDDEQLYIGSVILNRRAHGAFPDTIKGVVFQRGQYACTRDGNYYREPTEANWRNARWLLENGSVLPGNVVYQAGFRQGSGLYAQTRYHKYCYR